MGAGARMRRGLRGSLYALVLLSPLPFGSVQPWAVLAVQLWIVTLALGALWSCQKNLQPPRALMGAAAALLVVGLVQLSWGSISPPESLDALLRLAGYLLLALTTAVLLRDRRQLRTLAVVIVASAVFQALYGGFEYLSGRQQIFGYVKEAYLGSATGSFVNRNHFAAYLAMALPFAIGLLADPRHVSAPRRSWRERLLHALDADLATKTFAAIAVFAIWIGLLLSFSRAGLTVALLATATVGLMLPRPALSRRWIAAPVALAVLFLVYSVARVPGERFTDLGRALTADTGRVAVWEASLELIARNPLAGTGYGTFESAFESVRPAAIRANYDHAHNDWLEAWITGGLAVPLLLGWILYRAVRISRPRFGTPDRAFLLEASAAAAIVAIAAHSFVDFGLRIPAVAVLLSVIVGLRFSPDLDRGEVS